MSADIQAISDELRVELSAQYVRQNFESGEPWSMTIARAILAERERCAIIAEGNAKQFDFQKAFADCNDEARGAAGERIYVARQIRGEA